MGLFFPKNRESSFASLRLCVGIGSLLFLSTAWAGPRIVLDAAHGGDDTGVKAGGVTEKDWNLDFAKELAKALDEAGFTPVLTRKKDETLPQERRDESINTAQASAVLVIHAEREWSGTRKGPLIVVQPPNRPEAGGGDLPRWGFVSPLEYRTSLKLARSIAQGLGLGSDLSALSDSRGSAGERVSEEGRVLCLSHAGLRNLTPSAVVLIPLFLSSLEDRKALSEGEARAAFIAKVVQGLKEHFQMDAPATPTPAAAPPEAEATPAPEGTHVP
jgi:N-acetylmuramoyl-L-alanine amidase